MIFFGVGLVVLGVLAFAWSTAIGPLLWAPAAIVVFGIGCVLCAMSALRDSIHAASRQIIAALGQSSQGVEASAAIASVPGSREALIQNCVACGTVNARSARRCKNCRTSL
jgi:hypothetical protein